MALLDRRQQFSTRQGLARRPQGRPHRILGRLVNAIDGSSVLVFGKTFVGGILRGQMRQVKFANA